MRSYRDLSARDRSSSRLVDPADLPEVGAVIAGKYRIEKVLGQGGMATVVKAWHVSLERHVAVKILDRELIHSPELVERFMREARVAAKVAGEHVARTLDIDMIDGVTPFIVMEHLEGIDLAERLARGGRLPIEEAAGYLIEACEALALAHAEGIVHRDLKPSNLFLARAPDHRPTIKVLDFGIAKLVDEPMTDPTGMLGTIHYMSPEQLRAPSSVDARADIWALGVILHELLAGTPPFTGDNPVSLGRAILANDRASLASLRPDLPAEISAIVDQCLTRDTRDRYESVLDLALDLAPHASTRADASLRRIRGVLRGAESAPSLPPPPPQTSPSDVPITLSVQDLDATCPEPAPRRRLRWELVAGLTIAVAVGAGVLGGVLVARRGGVHARPVAAAAPPAAPSSPGAPVGEDETVTVRIRSNAPRSSVRIDDGALLPLPLEARLPRDGREHTMWIEAPGHVGKTKHVPLASDLVLVVALDPAPL